MKTRIPLVLNLIPIKALSSPIAIHLTPCSQTGPPTVQNTEVQTPFMAFIPEFHTLPVADTGSPDITAARQTGADIHIIVLQKTTESAIFWLYPISSTSCRHRHPGMPYREHELNFSRLQRLLGFAGLKK